MDKLTGSIGKGRPVRRSFHQDRRVGVRGLPRTATAVLLTMVLLLLPLRSSYAQNSAVTIDNTGS